AAGQVVEDGAEGGQVGRLAQDVEEAGQVPAVGDVLLGGDADEAAQRRGAGQLGQAVVEAAGGQGEGQDDDGPQAVDGVVVAAVAAGGAEAVEQGLVGEGAEQVAEGDQGGAVLELAPGEERFGGVDEHGAPPLRVVLGARGSVYSATAHPTTGRAGEKPAPRAGRSSAKTEKHGGSWVKDSEHRTQLPEPEELPTPHPAPFSSR